MPWIKIVTGMPMPDGTTESLKEYVCDTPNCGNLATHLLGIIVELREKSAVCDDCHQKILAA